MEYLSSANDPNRQPMPVTSFIKCIVAALIFFFSCVIARAQGPDSLQKSTQATHTVKQAAPTPATTDEAIDDDDFTPFLALFALVGIGLIVGSLIAGTILVVLALLILAGFVSAGIVSASVLVGLYKNSFAKGFKTFIVLCTTVAGGFAGAVGLWFLSIFSDLFSSEQAVLWGATIGIIAGMTFGFLAIYLIRQLTAYFKTKMNIAVQ